MPGTLFVVATPLGNLGDVTPRAIETLKKASIVACEDTRRTRVLLAHFGISPPRVVSYHKFNERQRTEAILTALESGQDVALVSDGGTPGVSDPGALLVESALKRGLAVSPVPGPSALSAAISASGFASTSFVFVGFLAPRKTARRRELRELEHEKRPMVFFEAPHRALEMAADLLAELGDRELTLVREVTKLHEEVARLSLSALVARFTQMPPRGEITLVVAGSTADARPKPEAGPPSDPGALRRRYEDMTASGTDRREALKRLVRESGLTRPEVYRAVRRKGKKNSG